MTMLHFYPARKGSIRTAERFVALCSMVVLLQFAAGRAAADCGDYLHSPLHGSHDQVVISDLASGKKPSSLPLNKKCYSCRGATLPATPPVTPPTSIRIDIKALLKHDVEVEANIHGSCFHDQVFVVSEGFYPSLLRPPIA